MKEELKHGNELIDRGIVYAPDFLINAGGLINVYMEHLAGYKQELAYLEAEKIYQTTLDILDRAEKEGKTTQESAMELALERIEKVGMLKLPFSAS